MSATVLHGRCENILPTLPDCSVDAVVTDPPYELNFMGKGWDSTGIAYSVDMWAEVLRVLKPGGHLLSFGGSRTWHRMAVAIEDAGFEMRDCITWHFGSGFPKSQDVSKAIDKAAGATRTERRAPKAGHENFVGRDNLAGLRDGSTVGTTEGGYARPWMNDPAKVEASHWNYAPATPDAARWEGWGTALKPATEFIVVARKPIAGTVASNVLTWGTGALNIGATRIQPGGGLLPLADSPGPAQDRGPCTCAERPACSTGGTSPGRESEPPAHIRRTHAAEPAATGLVDRSALHASAPQYESGYPRPQGSQDGYRSSRGSGDAPAREEVAAGQASAPPQPDADTSPARCATCGRTRSTQSMPYTNCTTPHVQRREETLIRPAIRRDDNAVLGKGLGVGTQVEPAGRWPANVILDEFAAAEMDRQSGERDPKPQRTGRKGGSNPNPMSWDVLHTDQTGTWPADPGGGASRFFYVAKAPKYERPKVNGIAHATVKPLTLIRYLVRLITPPGGTVLDPFAGSGTTGEACILEGFNSILIEREADHIPLIHHRIDRATDALGLFGEETA